jgi:Flp pilus assembly protein TadG
MTNLMREIPLDLPPRRRLGKYRADRSARHEEAQSLVELALLMPLFISILLGSAEFARFAWASVLTANAARAGAAFGAESLNNAGNTAGVQAAAAADSVNLTGLTTAPPTISCGCSNGAAIQRCTSSALGAATALSDCPSPATISNFVQVNTSMTLPWGFVRGVGPNFTVTGQSIMVIE